MKKTMVLCLIVTTFSLIPLTGIHASTLTSDQIRALVPTLSQTVSLLSQKLQLEQQRLGLENRLLFNISASLGAFSRQVAESGGILNPTQIQAFSTELLIAQNQVTDIRNRRIVFQNQINDIVSTLSSIVSNLI